MNKFFHQNLLFCSKYSIYQKELIASLVYDLINNTNTFTYEKLNKPIIKD